MDPAHDFDFIHGRWNVEHRRLKTRMVGSNEWEIFPGTCEARPILGGLGNADDNWIGLPSGPYHATSVRQFSPANQSWSIWWFDSRQPELSPPVVGGFAKGVGVFFGTDTFNGQAIRVRYIWSEITPNSARWEQAFARAEKPDDWETNWIMGFARSA